MKKFLLVLFMSMLFALTACSSVATPIQEVATEATSSTQISSPAIEYYPLDTKTKIEEIDVILDAVANGTHQDLTKLFGFTQTPCMSVVNGLGGPPACREDEKEGTLVEVLPSLSGEGSYLRKDEVGNFPGLNITGVYAIYQVSETAYSEENFPKGDYGIMLTAPENLPGIVLQIKDGQIIRIDYIFDPASIPTILQSDAATFVLPPNSK